MESSIPDIFAAGDVAYAPVFAADDRQASIGHWQLAHYHGRIAARNMAGSQAELRSIPFFWTMVFGVSVRYAGKHFIRLIFKNKSNLVLCSSKLLEFSGYGAGFEDIVITGDVSTMSFIAHYCIGDVVVAVATMGSDPAAAKFAELLAMKKTLSKEDVQKNGNAWVDSPLF